MTSLTITQARKDLYNLVDHTHASHEPVHIAGKRGGAVLISDEDWSSIQETVCLLSIPGMRESILNGMNTPVSKCDRELAW